MTEFGIWVLPATMDAVRQASEATFDVYDYDAAERHAIRRGSTDITTADIQAIVDLRESKAEE